jgi:hypothetical protein
MERRPRASYSHGEASDSARNEWEFKRGDHGVSAWSQARLADGGGRRCQHGTAGPTCQSGKELRTGSGGKGKWAAGLFLLPGRGVPPGPFHIFLFFFYFLYLIITFAFDVQMTSNKFVKFSKIQFNILGQ